MMTIARSKPVAASVSVFAFPPPRYEMEMGLGREDARNGWDWGLTFQFLHICWEHGLVNGFSARLDVLLRETSNQITNFFAARLVD